MSKRNFHLYIRAMAACMKRMVESTKGLGHRDIKRATRDFYFLLLVLIKEFGRICNGCCCIHGWYGLNQYKSIL